MNQLLSKEVQVAWVTNRKSYFKNTCVTVTGISSFHKLTAVSIKYHILKASPKIKT